MFGIGKMLLRKVTLKRMSEFKSIVSLPEKDIFGRVVVIVFPVEIDRIPSTRTSFL